MKWKSMKEITEEELYPVINGMFNIIGLKIISASHDTIFVSVQTYWDIDGEKTVFNDTICLRNRVFISGYSENIEWDNVVFDINAEHKWEQFLMARGYHSIYKKLIDNPYLERGDYNG